MRGACSLFLILTFASALPITLALTFSRYSIVRFHNKIRKHERSSGMKFIHWDDTLAKKATHWARHCYYQHEGSDFGENFGYVTVKHSQAKELSAASSGRSTDRLINRSIRRIMRSWYRESTVYHWSKLTCGKSCHYTQMVWENTSSIGCAVNLCKNLTAFDVIRVPALFLACYYWPRGNVIGDQPFHEGYACSKCESGERCANGLCYQKRIKVPDSKETKHWINQLDSGAASFREDAALPQKDSPHTNKQNTCKDVFPQLCPEWTTNGECEKQKIRMKMFCNASCKFCQTEQQMLGTQNDQTAESTCVDLYDSRQCYIWTVQGECIRNTLAMARFCQRTCNMCRKGIDSSFADDTKKRAKYVPVYCKDRLLPETCRKFKENSMCKSRATRNAMKTSCKKTCDFCSKKGLKRKKYMQKLASKSVKVDRDTSVFNNMSIYNYTSSSNLNYTGNITLTSNITVDINFLQRDDSSVYRKRFDKRRKRGIVLCKNKRIEKECVVLAAFGHCQTSKRKMRKLCPLTCNFRCFKCNCRKRKKKRKQSKKYKTTMVNGTMHY